LSVAKACYFSSAWWEEDHRSFLQWIEHLSLITWYFLGRALLSGSVPIAQLSHGQIEFCKTTGGKTHNCYCNNTDNCCLTPCWQFNTLLLVLKQLQLQFTTTIVHSLVNTSTAQQGVKQQHSDSASCARYPTGDSDRSVSALGSTVFTVS
jgi:hypothetical protein